MKKCKKISSAILLALILNPLALYAKSFSDVENHWAKNSIEYAIEKDYAHGYDDKTFKPNEKVTRAEFLSFLNSFFYADENFTEIIANSSYKDSGSWYQKDLLMAESIGVLPYELSGEYFSPNATINREEAAGLTHAYLTALRTKENRFRSGKLDATETENLASEVKSTLEIINNNSNIKASLNYNDAYEVSDIYSIGILSLANEKILSGYPDGSFKPKEGISRAEAINLLLSAKGEKIEKASNDIPQEISKPAKNRAQEIVAEDGKSYFINQDGSTYYNDKDKGIVKGWKQIGESLYYFSPIDGKMYKDGIFSTGEGVYWFDKDGKIKTGKRPGGHVGRKISWSYPTAKELENNWLKIDNAEARYKAQEVANFAASKEGLPFKWFGCDLNDPSGVYCCGTVYSAYKELGVHVPGPNDCDMYADKGYQMVKAQYTRAEEFGGVHVNKEETLYPGDVFYYYNPKWSYGYNHAAIYLGTNGNRKIIIHATLADGLVTESESKVFSWGYKPLKAVRFIK
ncbi:S-layer homology domain-containing protein [Peptoniphilus grossensis]|uniref:S-layer homology domain-containing protein n=1 Tax=Peptoniphilus grossensis TaxID=1465756 RepID=UPI00399AD7C6